MCNVLAVITVTLKKEKRKKTETVGDVRDFCMITNKEKVSNIMHASLASTKRRGFERVQMTLRYNITSDLHVTIRSMFYSCKLTNAGTKQRTK